MIILRFGFAAWFKQTQAVWLRSLRQVFLAGTVTVSEQIKTKTI
jgi:hypothetical protein